MNKFKEIILYFPSLENGGMEKNLLNMFNYLAETKKIKITLFCIHINRNIKKQISTKINIIKYNTKKKFFLKRFLISIISFSFFYKILKKNYSTKNTIIFSAQNSVLCIVLANILNFKIIIRNGNHPWSSMLYSDHTIMNFLSFILRLIFYNYADKIICNSIKSTIFFKNILFIKSSILCIPNSVNLKKFKDTKKRDNYIVSAGRLTKQKNFETLIKAFSLFANKYDNYKLLILGEGNKKKKLINLATKLNIKKKVIFKNFVKDPSKIFIKSKIYVCSSLYEGLPSSLIESLNTFTPVISTNCLSGPSQILKNGNYGYLYPIKNYLRLSKLMEYVVNNYHEAKRKTIKGQKSLSQYDVKYISMKYLKEINSLF